jgi:hypothetical protein
LKATVFNHEVKFLVDQKWNSLQSCRGKAVKHRNQTHLEQGLPTASAGKGAASGLSLSSIINANKKLCNRTRQSVNPTIFLIPIACGRARRNRPQRATNIPNAHSMLMRIWTHAALYILERGDTVTIVDVSS